VRTHQKNDHINEKLHILENLKFQC